MSHTTTMLTKAFALYLPEHTLDYFDITSCDVTDELVHITLTEKNNPPAHIPGTPKARGFKTITISDFPIRGRRALLTFHRRYWQVDGTGTMYMNDITLTAPGTKLEKAFADFLKEGGRERAELFSKYRPGCTDTGERV